MQGMLQGISCGLFHRPLLPGWLVQSAGADFPASRRAVKPTRELHGYYILLDGAELNGSCLQSMPCVLLRLLRMFRRAVQSFPLLFTSSSLVFLGVSATDGR